MAASDARPFPLKNTAFRVTFPIFDNDGDLVAGAAGLDSEISKDGGTFTDCTNEATQLATSSGIYYLDLTSTEMNADTVAIIVKTTTTDAKTTPIILYPGSTTTAHIGVNVVNAGGTAWGSGAITAGAIASSAITSAKIASGAITSTGIAASAIGASQIATGAITSAKFAASAIDATAIASNAITSAKVATDAIGSAQFAQAAADKAWSTTTRQLTGTQTFNVTGDITGNLSGSVGSVTGAVGSVTGAVGSVTGNVGGNVTGTIGGLTAGALADLFDTDSGTTYGSAVAGSVVKEIADNSGGGTPPTAAAIADAVWDEAIADHLTSGSTGESLNAAGGAGDPWVTTLPGSYTGSQAGKILSDVLTDTAEIGAAGAGLTAINLPDQTMNITGDITGNLSGTIGGLTAGALADMFDTDSGTTYGSAVAGSVVKEIADNAAGGGGPTAAAIADAVWDEATAGHVSAGTFGKGVFISGTKTTLDDLNDVAQTDIVSDGQPIQTTNGEVDSVGLVSGNVGGNVAGSVGSVAAINTTGGAVTAVTEVQGFNAAAKAEIQTEADDALVARKLDRLFTTAVSGVDVTDNAALAKIVSASATADWDSFNNTTDSLEALAGASAPSAASIRAEIDSNSTQLAAIVADTGTDIPASIAALNDVSVSDILTTQMTESYAANGVAPTLAQCQFAIHQMLMQFGISGTSLTVRKLDDATTAFVVTLDSATAPTDASRS